jgi:hypothetical protein
MFSVYRVTFRTHDASEPDPELFLLAVLVTR